MFRINSRCISCGTCWQFDPEHFANGGDAAVVCQQPRELPALQRALLALQACPVAAIEASAEQRLQRPDDGFPVLVTRHRHGEVFYCGWASKRSFGACSWLICRPDGNVMVDVPRWSAPLARRIEALGGLAAIVLTHRDDVADHARWARAFGAERWIHGADSQAAKPPRASIRRARGALQRGTSTITLPSGRRINQLQAPKLRLEAHPQ